MKILFLLQFTSLLSMLINAMLLGLGSLHVRWKNRRYEQSRWMLFAAMLILAAHFLAQMTMSVRASDADLGAVLNLLAYPPSFALIALSIYNIEAVHGNRRRFIAGIVGLYTLIVVCYAIGYCCNGSMRIGMWMYVMLALYICLVAYCICKASRQILLRRKLLETLTASDMLPHVRFAKTSVTVLFVASMTMPFVILFNKILVIYAPVILLAIFFFVLTFCNLGFNYVPTEELVNDDDESARSTSANGLEARQPPPTIWQPCRPSASASSPSAWTSGARTRATATAMPTCSPSRACCSSLGQSLPATSSRT